MNDSPKIIEDCIKELAEREVIEETKDGVTVRLSRTERLRIESSGRVIPDPWRRDNSHRSFGGD